MGNYWQRNNIILRSLEESDIELYNEKRMKPDSTRQWLYDELLFPQSKKDIQEWFHDATKKNNSNDNMTLIIEDLEHHYAGEIYVWHTDRRNGSFKYGIFIEEFFRGQGFGKDALIILLDFYFNELNYHKCCPSAYAFNEGSRKFHEKFGFTIEGLIREEIYTRGRHHDLYYYGMLKEEFNQKYHHFS